MAKIYTKSGDDGTTGLFQQGRVPKNSPVIEVIGAIDELNTVLGILISHEPGTELVEFLKRLQIALFDMGAAIASPLDSANLGKATDQLITCQVETEIDRMESKLEPLNKFVLPGGSIHAAYAHLCRSTCRNTERRFVAFLSEPNDETSREGYLPFLQLINRLSDFFFVLARYLNHLNGQPDVHWQLDRE